ILPFAGLKLALNIDLRAFTQILLGDADQIFVEDGDRVPFGALAPLAGAFVLPVLGGSNAQVAHFAAVLEGAHLGIAAQIANDDDFVNRPGHVHSPDRAWNLTLCYIT